MRRKSFVVLLTLLLIFNCFACGHQHTFNSGEITTQPTCTSEGVKTYTCTECGKTKTEKIPMADHKYTPGEVITEATCTQEGQRETTCSVCGAKGTESIPKTSHEYTEEIVKEATFTSEGEKKYTCSICGDSYTEAIPVRDEEVVVTVIEKTNLAKNYNQNRYSDRVEMTFRLENMTDKDIKGVQGILTISDMFGEEIMSSGCDFTGNVIPAKSSIDVSGLGFDINEFLDYHVKLYNTALEDLIFSYEISNVIYADGSAKSGSTASQSETKSDEVEVIVTDKKSLAENYSAGRYSPRVEMTFQIKNNTDKDIKGIQGVLTIMDLFGDEIQSLNCDFTGITVPAGGTAEKSGLGFDVNQFMDDDVKVYNEDFEDLKFSYEVTSIVYK
ncbi:hypothetical protein [Butyrivibrio proteoclasticus]|uniref:hypothetical protein n=1 Tax=Butyrivibrio proteoclasticus TaxID=43305 RepID=UPI000685F26B|nr:hypothetical protein [Butyrivibrio proteoclasticus]